MVQGTGRLHRPQRPTQRIATMIVATALTTTGCQSMAMTPTRSTSLDGSAISPTVPEWPLKFERHAFGARCYDTIGCQVTYNGLRHGVEDADRVSPPLSDALGTPDQIFRAMHLSIRNFPPPAQVRWRSKDGAPHEAEVDIGKIFADELILHHVSRDDLHDGSIPDPAIILVVEDRAISVYMRASLSTKSFRTPGNRYSNFRNDLVLAWSQTY